MVYIRHISGILTVVVTATAAMVALSVAGCAPVVAASAKNQVPVSVHGVNYTGKEFTYVVIDPANPSNTAGGELVEPFSAGGTMCCFELPVKWLPGIQVLVRTTNVSVAKAGKPRSEVRNTYTLDIPPYIDGKAGELWVIRTGAGEVELVSSDFQPDHAKWPGKIKGWPVPSIEYRRTRWDLYIDAQRGSVNNYQELLGLLESKPEEALRDAWALEIKHFPDKVKHFSGPLDPGYRAYLKNRYQTSLADAVERLRQMEAQKP